MTIGRTEYCLYVPVSVAIKALTFLEEAPRTIHCRVRNSEQSGFAGHEEGFRLLSYLFCKQSIPKQLSVLQKR